MLKEKNPMRKICFLFVVLTMLLTACSSPAAPAAAPAAPAASAPQPQACPTCAAAAAAQPAAAVAPTGFGEILKAVQARGKLKCGVNPANPGFSVVDSAGNYAGLDIDRCRAVAVAIFNDPKAVEFVNTTGETRFTLLQNKEIDVLIRSTTWTFTRDTDLGLNFAPPYLYDGQGIMVRKSSGFTKLEDLNGATICMGRGATTILPMPWLPKTSNTPPACLMIPTMSSPPSSRAAAMPCRMTNLVSWPSAP
jgi:general L-amino acid transport system substrate-binding protein